MRLRLLRSTRPTDVTSVLVIVANSGKACFDSLAYSLRQMRAKSRAIERFTLKCPDKYHFSGKC